MNNTLTNGLALLSLVAGTARPHGVTELARQADLPKSHVHRLLQSLVEARYLEKDAQSRYRISVGALRLGRELLRNLPARRAALPIMMELVREHAVALSLAIPFGVNAISIAHFSHDGEMRDSMESLGSELSAHASASGKLFLAYKTRAELSEILPELNYEARGPNAHRNARSLRADLRRIRERGYSVNDREGGADVVSLAVPVRDGEGEVCAALGAAGTVNEFSAARVKSLAAILQEAAGRIELSIHEEKPV